MKYFSINIIIIFYILLSYSKISANPQLIQDVAGDLAHAITKTNKRPIIKISNSDLEFATQYRQPNTIILDKRVYDICLQSKSLPDAFAIILTPELIDLYGKMHKYEAAFAQIAGYDILQNANQLWEKVYKLYPKLPTSTYTPLERKKIINETKETFQQIQPVFEIANHLTLVGKLDIAHQLYQHLYDSFPSDKMENNLAVNITLQAQHAFREHNIEMFIYPLALESEFELSKKGISLQKLEEIKNQLRSAKRHFANIVRSNPNNAIGYLNLTNVSNLLKEYKNAVRYSEITSKLANEQKLEEIGGYANISKAIAFYHSNKKAEAKKLFEKESLNKNQTVKEVAQANLNITNKKNWLTPNNERLYSAREKIENIYLTKYQDEGFLPQITTKLKDYTIYAINLEYSQVYFLDYKENGKRKFYALHKTLHDYKESSALDIRIGTPISLVIDKHGIPKHAIATQYGFILKYSKITYEIKNGKVSGWALSREWNF